MLYMTKSQKFIYDYLYANVFLINNKLNYISISRTKEHIWIKNLNGLSLTQSYPLNIEAEWEINLINLDLLKDKKEEIMAKLIIKDIKHSEIIKIYKDIFDAIKKLPSNKYQNFDYTLCDESCSPRSIKDENYIKRGIFFYKRI